MSAFVWDSGTAASAATVFSQPWVHEAGGGVNGANSDGPTNTATFPFDSSQQVADEFFGLPADTTITGLSWHGSYHLGNVPLDAKTFVIRFWSEASGAPDGIIFEQSVTALGIDTLLDNERNDSVMSYMATVDDAPELDAATTYFLSIMENDASTVSVWTWANNAPGPYFARGSEALPWVPKVTSTFNLAFSLSDDPPPPPPVPLPASLVLLAFGLMPVAFRRRVR